MVCLGFEPGPQDGRRRRNHLAMAATFFVYICLSVILFSSYFAPSSYGERSLSERCYV